MIKLVSKNKEYLIPSSWSDVTYQQYLDLQNEKNDLKILSILTKLPVETIKRLSPSSIEKIALVLGFINHPINLKDLTTPEYLITSNNIKIELIKDIRTKSFGQKIYLHQLVKDNQEDIVNHLIDIVLIYSQEQITKKSFDITKINELNYLFSNIFLVDLYSVAMFYIEQLKDILEVENETLSSQPTYEQRQAGIDMFNDFGVMNTIKALAGGDVTKYSEVEKIEYNIVYVHLLMNKTQGIFEDNYRKVMKNKR